MNLETSSLYKKIVDYNFIHNLFTYSIDYLLFIVNKINT